MPHLPDSAYSAGPLAVIAILPFLLGGCQHAAESRAPPTLLTAREPPHACMEDLIAAHASFSKPESPPPPCTIETPVRVSTLSVALKPPALMSCDLAATLLRFTHEIVEPAGQRLLGRHVIAIDNFGAYNCRSVRDRPNRLSEHALGAAIDMSGVTLDDGTHVMVATSWNDPGPGGRFLHEVARAACRYFSVVLTPGSNADHRDHLHLDRGTWRQCGPA